MAHPQPDAREQAESRVLENQISYSLVQLRLVGVLLLAVVLARAVVLLILNPHVDAIQRLAGISNLANWLPLLALGSSLYLLGGGRNRLPREPLITTLLHQGLLPMALVCLVGMPGLILSELKTAQPLINSGLTPYQLEQLGAMRTATAILLSVIAGTGLLVLKRQGDREIADHRLTVSQFFEVGPRRRLRRSRR